MIFGTANIDVDFRIFFSILLSDSPPHVPLFVLCVRLVDSCRLCLFFIYCTSMLFPRRLNKYILGYSKIRPKILQNSY